MGPSKSICWGLGPVFKRLPEGGTHPLPTFARFMCHPFFGAWWPKGCICHDSGAGLISANGWTPMDEGTTLEDKHIPWGASKSATLAICGQEGSEIIAHMIMPRRASLVLRGKLVAAWPNVEGPICQCQNSLHAPLVLLIPMCRCFLRSSALAGFSSKGGREKYPRAYWNYLKDSPHSDISWKFV